MSISILAFSIVIHVKCYFYLYTFNTLLLDFYLLYMVTVTLSNILTTYLYFYSGMTFELFFQHCTL